MYTMMKKVDDFKKAVNDIRGLLDSNGVRDYKIFYDPSFFIDKYDLGDSVYPPNICVDLSNCPNIDTIDDLVDSVVYLSDLKFFKNVSKESLDGSENLIQLSDSLC